jgi:CubicO group peptidase (beta-lactamase class C family)
MVGKLSVFIAAASLVAVPPGSAVAQEAAASESAAPSAFPSDRTIQKLLDDYVTAKRCEGVVLATYVPGRKRIYVAGTSGRPGLPLDGDTLFEIGSITKTLTASLLADMVQRKEVKLDDPVSQHLPAGVRVPERGGRQIMLVDLATHTSGLPGLPSNIRPKDIANPYSDYTTAMLDEFLAGHALTRDIGAEYEYSAVGMGLLGRALGHRLGTTWEAALEQRILRPLGMRSTGANLGPQLRRRLAQGHDEAGRPAPDWDIPALPAMGALKSSANDLAKFLAANIDSASRPFGGLFAPMHAPRAIMDEETKVGLAWQIGHATNRSMVWHGGGTGGSRALIAFEPEKQMGVVVLCNSARGADDIGFHLLDPTLPV